ncbi:hypothetical protein CRYUN_Cryun40dG0064200 [Craigia yunnanensis]
MGGNKLEGKLPRSLANCTKLEVLDLGNNMVHDTFPFWLEKLPFLKVIVLRVNRFYGAINFSEGGNAVPMLRILDLASNDFSASLAQFLALGNLNDLESLDLSRNKLSGKIPLQLTSLTFLAVLNLSYNQLEGSIPQSYQFGTFSNDSYKGNLRLCGMPLTRKCNEADIPMARTGEDVDSWVDGISVWKIVLIAYGSGLVVGLSIGYTVLNEMGNKWLDRYKRNKESKKIKVIPSEFIFQSQQVM